MILISWGWRDIRRNTASIEALPDMAIESYFTRLRKPYLVLGVKYAG